MSNIYFGGLSDLGLDPWPIGNYLRQLDSAQLKKMEADLIKKIKETSPFRFKTKAELKERLAKVQDELYSIRGIEQRVTYQQRKIEVQQLTKPKLISPAKKGLVTIPSADLFVEEPEEPEAFDFKQLIVPAGLAITVLVGFFALRK